MGSVDAIDAIHSVGCHVVCVRDCKFCNVRAVSLEETALKECGQFLSFRRRITVRFSDRRRFAGVQARVHSVHLEKLPGGSSCENPSRDEPRKFDLHGARDKKRLESFLSRPVSPVPMRNLRAAPLCSCWP